MTKLQKQKQFVRDYFIQSIPEDNYGHFKHNGYRIKMQKNCFRFERKMTYGWLRLASVYYKDANENNLAQVVNHIFRNGEK